MKRVISGKKILQLLCLSLLLFPVSAGGHDLPQTGISEGTAGLEEKVGQHIPKDILLSNEAGRTIRLGDMLGKPVILTLVYYTCEHICPQMLEGLALAIPRLARAAGRDFQLITVSFDITDTPQAAGEAKRNYLKAAGKSFAADTDIWKFLTGDAENIRRLTEAAGFSYREDIHGFIHPVVLIFLSPTGEIAGYLPVSKYEYGAAYPVYFSSYELNVALEEADSGKPITRVRRAVLYCFSHEPPGQSRFFYFIGIIGLLTLAAMASFFVYLQVTAKRYRGDEQHDNGK